MRKILYAFILISFAFTACDKSDDGDLDDLKKENQELREALAANSKITNVEFTETEMILTYSNGLKLSSPIPDVLKGKPGDTPRVGDNGNWWIGDIDTGVIAQGQNGTNGADGSNGADGADGSNGSDGTNGADGADGNSPYIGDNGNWWINEADTGIAAMGENGADGADGVGIKSIVYDPATGMMTITLTNDQVTKFVVASNDNGDLSAKILEDLNGKYVMTKATMGDIPYVEIEYNKDNQISKIISSTADGYQLLKSFEIEKEYTDGKVAKIIRRDFATEQIVKYEDENIGSIITVDFDTDKGDRFIEENSDGTYSFYRKNYDLAGVISTSYRKYFTTKNEQVENDIVDNGDGTYTYYKYGGRYSVDDVDYYIYDVYIDCTSEIAAYSEKIGEDKFKLYTQLLDSYHSHTMNGESINIDLYRAYMIRTITGVYEIGDPIKELYSTLEYNSTGKVEKIYESKVEGVEANSYVKNSYDANGNCIQIDQYSLKEGEWLKDEYYITNAYTAQNLLSKTTEHLADGSENDVLKVIYDSEGNPAEIFKYFSSATYRDLYGYDSDRIDPETGLRIDEDDIAKEAGLYSYVKVDYNYNMKNFLGNTIGAVFPELYGFAYNNAIKNITVSSTVLAGSIDYKDFNDGGYPQIMEFIATGDKGAYSGQLKLEYLKLKE